MTLATIYSERTAACNHFFRDYSGPPFAIRGPNWHWRSTSAAEPAFTLIVKSSEGWDRLLDNATELSLAEAFISGEIDVDGDIFSVFELAKYVTSYEPNFADRALLAGRRALLHLVERLRRGRLHSRRRDSSSIAYHYDQPVEFYAPWLGGSMLYSAAYFRNPKDDLDTAQTSKLDLICRKLDLQPGEDFLDIGCGWGSLSIHAAQQYQAKTRGITLSRTQARTGEARTMQAHLANQCFVEVRDYRDAPALPFRYDKAASIGMFEHVGADRLPEYFSTVFKLVKPGGAFLNSGIVRSAHKREPRESFIDHYVFPDGDLPTLSEALQAAEQAGWEVRDVECLREHYAHTLRLWVHGLLAHKPELLNTVAERTFRIWLLYMAGSAVAFERGDISCFQVLLARPSGAANRDLSTRERWYKEAPPGPTRLAA